MGAKKISNINTHVVDILGNVKGRDQPIMLMDRALNLVCTISEKNFLDNDVVFFDPFCKAGEILLSSALKTCLTRNKSKGSLLDIQEVEEELYKSKRYYGLSPDERHHRLSLRTFLGNEHSHNEVYQKIIKNGNYLSEIDGKLEEEAFKKEFEAMIEFIKKDSGKNKIIALGNPPYQENDGGAKASAKPIYNFFVDHMIESGEIDEMALVLPARWFSGGRSSLKAFRERLINSGHDQPFILVPPTLKYSACKVCFY